MTHGSVIRAVGASEDLIQQLINHLKAKIGLRYTYIHNQYVPRSKQAACGL
jgi:hypothetical protein